MSQDEAAVNDQVVAEPTATESAPVETNTSEVADPILDTLSSDDISPVVEVPETESEKPTEEPPEAPEEEATAEETTTDEPRGEEKPLTPKSENRFQKLANENKELRQELERINSEVYKPQTAEELIEEGLSPEMAEVRELKQTLELQAYNNKVYEAQVSLSNEAEQVLKDFTMFNPDSPDFDADIAADAAEALEGVLIKDPNTGQIIGSHLTPYQIYKPIADAYKKSQLRGEIKGQKATEKMLASVDARPSATPTKAKEDPLLAILKSDD